MSKDEPEVAASQPEKETALAPPPAIHREKLPPCILHPEIHTENRTNYRINNDDLGIGTPSERFYHNIHAIELLKKLERENRLATPFEQDIMADYQESLVYIQPQGKFKKMIQAYERAKHSGYYDVAGAEPYTVVVLKQKIGNIPAGTKLLWVCGDRGFHNVAGIFGGNLQTGGHIQIIPVEDVFDPDDNCLKGIDFESPVPTENAFMKRYSAENYAFRTRMGIER